MRLVQVQEFCWEDATRSLLKADFARACQALGLSDAGTKADLVGRVEQALAEQERQRRVRPERRSRRPQSRARGHQPRRASFAKAREFARSLKLKSNSEWRSYAKGERRDLPPLPDTLPRDPAKVYRAEGWTYWGDFLGNGTRQRPKVYRSFEQARAFARSLKLASSVDWAPYCKGAFPELPEKPIDVPANPNSVYAGEWKGYGDWLGTGNVRTKKFVSYAEAQRLAQAAGVRSLRAYQRWVSGRDPERPQPEATLPFSPQAIYGSEWSGSGAFLGTGWTTGRSWQPYAKARAFVRALGLKSQDDWRAYCRGERPGLPPRPSEIPSSPWSVYKQKGWVGFGDWLGTGRQHSREKSIRPFEQARAFARGLRLRTVGDWWAWRRGALPDLPEVPPDIPGEPKRAYGEAWLGWKDWLWDSEKPPPPARSPRRKAFRSRRTQGVTPGEIASEVFVLERGGKRHVNPAALKELRRALGWTQADLAGAAGLPTHAVVTWERGRARPGLANGKRLEGLLERLSTGYVPPPDTDAHQPLGVRLRSLRRRRGWSQQRLAERLGRSETTIRAWERGSPPEVSQRLVLEDVLRAEQALDVSRAGLAQKKGLAPLEVLKPRATSRRGKVRLRPVKRHGDLPLHGWVLVEPGEVFAYLHEVGATQVTLAQTLGVSRSTVSAWKHGRGSPGETFQRYLLLLVLQRPPGLPRFAPTRVLRELRRNFDGSALYAKRQEGELSEMQLARRLGVPATSILLWESGDSVPAGKNLTKILGFLHGSVSTDEEL